MSKAFLIMGWEVYIMHSDKLNRFYIGCTRKMEERIQQHLTHFFGEDAFTAKADDWVLKLQLACKDERQAKSVEQHIKKMKRSKYINNLIQFTEMQERLLSRF